VPIYEYLCQACGGLTELMQKVGDPAPRRCPDCGSRKIAKLVSRTTFRLKGGGWYADLYSTPKKDGERKGTHSAPAAAQGAASPAPADSQGGGAEPKPATSAKPSPTPRKAKDG
jgi:putative FmdB family regulatory protein